MGDSSLLTPQIVEARITEAGREEVFARARELGWSGMEPPLWVWNQIALEMLASRAHPRTGEER